MAERALLLVPTPLEWRHLEPLLAAKLTRSPHWQVQSCGFGPIAAAATTARLLAEDRPSQVCLVGIAGRYSNALRIGEAYWFRHVCQDGVGVGQANQYQSMSDLGWLPLETMRSLDNVDRLPVQLPEHRDLEDAPVAPGWLISVACVSRDPSESRRRQERYADAVAEDMEGYAVALACREAGVPLSILRGISNDAGDRDHAHWKIATALAAVAERW